MGGGPAAGILWAANGVKMCSIQFLLFDRRQSCTYVQPSALPYAEFIRNATDGPEADPEAYEQECLAETSKQLTRVTAYEREPYQLRSVRLEGQFPDTRIVVTLWDTRFDKEVQRSYSVWQEHTFVAYEEIRADPESVGMFITTWSLGG